jgi:hypothetical protein
LSPIIRAGNSSSRQGDGSSSRCSIGKHPTISSLPLQGTINLSSSSSSNSAKGMETNASRVAMQATMPRIARGISQGRCQHQTKTKEGSRKCKLGKGSSTSLLWKSYLKEPIMTGTFFVFHQPSLILFDSGASHSFVSQKFSAKCQLPFCHTRGSFMIATPRGKVATNQLNQSVPIQSGSKIFKSTLLILGLENVDIILGAN